MALEKLDGITGAYVNSDITIHLTKGAVLDKDKIAETIKPLKITIEEVKKLEEKPF